MPSINKADFSSRNKIVSLKALKAAVEAQQRRGKKIVFTNGCYDLLHAGHVRLLEKSKSCGDVLVVAINSDRSLRGLKGSGRPVARQMDRARVIAALACVDYVTIFGSSTPYSIIKTIRPDVLIKGADWKLQDIVGKDILDSYGGEIRRLPLLKGYSTSGLITRIRSGKSAIE